MNKLKILELLKDYLLPVVIAFTGCLLSWAQIKSSQIQSAESIQAEFIGIYYQDLVKNKDQEAADAIGRIQKRLNEQVNTKSWVDNSFSWLLGFDEWKPLDFEGRPKPNSLSSKNFEELPEPNSTSQAQPELLPAPTLTPEATLEPTPTPVPIPEVTPEPAPTPTLEKSILKQYTIYIQYPYSGDKEAVENFSQSLKDEGYVVPPIEEMKRDFKFEASSIRYFHKEDRNIAENLREQVKENLENQSDISVLDLGKRYPNVRKGVLEVWINKRIENKEW